MGSLAPLGLTVGDCAGVGPELLLRAAPALSLHGPIVAYGDANVLRAALVDLRSRHGLSAELVDEVVAVDGPADAYRVGASSLPVVHVASGWSGSDAYPWGEVVPVFGRLQYDSLVRAIDDAQSGCISGIVTAPWHKARLRDAGLPPTGHTEVLASQSHTERVVMVLAGDVLRVALVTAHLPLRDVADHITSDEIVAVARIFADGLTQLYGIAQPHIAVCGLNPHAGEGGVLGHEDAEVIAPAIAALRGVGFDASGPHPADTIFPMVCHGRVHADGVLAMYHDQGLGPLKTFHFGRSANITFGLPFIRTSVDHGTAYDIAGRLTASTESFVYAAMLAREFAARRSAN